MKPPAVTTAQVILWIQGGLSAVLAFALLAMSARTDVAIDRLLVFIVFTLAQAGVEIASAVGIAAGRSWARATGISIEVLAIIFVGISLLGGGGGSAFSCGSVIGLALAGTVIYCLAQEDTREWCRQNS